MASRLETLPTEVVELIVRQLPLKDIRNLRLTCKGLKDKSSESHFKTFFHTQHVDVTASTIRAFIDDVQAGGFRSCVRRLCLVGVADKKAESPQTSQFHLREEENICLLTQTFDGLAKYHKSDTHLSLSLGLRIVYDGVSRNLPLANATTHLAKSRSVWQCAVETLDQSLRALAVSKLQLKGLDIFNGPNMENCALPSEQLNIIDWNDPGLVESLSTLTCLSVNLSTRIFLFENHRDPSGEERTRNGTTRRVVQEEAQNEGNFDGLTHILPVCPRLEDLDLRYRSLGARTQYCNWKVLQLVAGMQTLPVLKRLSIHSFTVHSADLLSILERTKPRELSLGPIWLETGTFHAIFDYCSSPRSGVSKASFERLVQTSHRDGAGVVHFVSQSPKVPVARNPSPTSPFQAQFCSELAEAENLGLGARISCHLDRSGFIGMPRYGGCPPSRRQDHLNNYF